MTKKSVAFLTLVISIFAMALGGFVTYFFIGKLQPKPKPQPEVSAPVVDEIYGGLIFATDGLIDIEGEFYFEGTKTTYSTQTFTLNSTTKTLVFDDIDISMIDILTPMTVHVKLKHNYQYQRINVKMSIYGEIENSNYEFYLNDQVLMSDSHTMTGIASNGNEAHYKFTITSQDMISLANGRASVLFDMSLDRDDINGTLAFVSDGEAEVDVVVGFEGIEHDFYLPPFKLDETNQMKLFEDVEITMADINTPVAMNVYISHNYQYEGVSVNLYFDEPIENATFNAYIDGYEVTDFEHIILEKSLGGGQAVYRFEMGSVDMLNLIRGNTGIGFEMALYKPDIEYTVSGSGIGIYEDSFSNPLKLGLTTDSDYTLPSSFDVVGPTDYNRYELYSDEEIQKTFALIEDSGYTTNDILNFSAKGMVKIPYLLLMQLGQDVGTPIFKNQLDVSLEGESAVLKQMQNIMLYAMVTAMYGDANGISQNAYLEAGVAYMLALMQAYMEQGLTYEMVSTLAPNVATYIDKIGGMPVPGTTQEEMFFLAAVADENFFTALYQSSEDLIESSGLTAPTQISIKYFNLIPGNEYPISTLQTLIPEMGIMSHMVVNNLNIGSNINYTITRLPNVSAKQFVLEEGSQFSTVNGELLSSDGTVLVAYNRGSELTEYTVPTSVVTISPSALFNGVVLTTVYDKLQSININYEQMSNIPTLSTSDAQTVVNSDKYISRYQIAEWESNRITNVKIVYVDNRTSFSYEFDELKNGYMITKFNSSQPFVSIPETYTPEGGEEYEVVGIKTGAFADCAALANIKLNSNIHYLEDGAFAGIEAMKEIDFGHILLAECGKDLFGTRTDIIIYSQLGTTAQKIKASSTCATFLDMSFLIETELGTGGTGAIADQKGTFKVSFKFGTTTISLDTTYYNEISSKFNGYAVLFGAEGAELDVSVDVNLDVSLPDSAGRIDHIQEQVAIGKYESDGSTTLIAGTAKNVQYVNHSTPQVSVSYAGKANVGDDLILTVNFVVMTYVQCFTEGTLVTLADGSTKPIENVTYDDLLLVYDFDRGEFSYSYPVWISQPGQYSNYFLMKFDDGSEVEIVLSHRLFNTQNLSFEKSVDALYTQVGQPFFKQSIDQNGNPVITTPKCISIEKIKKTCTYYNMVTSQALNFFANGFLGSTGISNIYTFEKLENGHYIHNQEELETTRGTETIPEDMFSYEQFDTSKITYEMYVAYRLGESKNMADILANSPPYNQYPIEMVYKIAIQTINDYFREDYHETKVLWPDTFKVTTSDGVSIRVNPSSTYTLQAPTNTDGFVGWYNSFDGKIYKVGDSVTIYMNTHFIARYN